MLKISSGICRCFLTHLNWGFWWDFWCKTALDLYFFLGGQLEQKNPWPTAVQPLRCCQEFPEVCRAAGGKIVDFLREIWVFKRHVIWSVIFIYTLAKYNYRLYHMHKCRHILTYTYWDTLWYIVCNILIDSHGNGSYRLVTWDQRFRVHFCFHPKKWIWNLKITCLKRKIIFQTSMIMFHVNFQGCFSSGIHFLRGLPELCWMTNAVLQRLLDVLRVGILVSPVVYAHSSGV